MIIQNQMLLFSNAEGLTKGTLGLKKLFNETNYFFIRIFQLPLYSYSNCEESERTFSGQTVEEILGLFTLAGCGLLVFISFAPEARLLKLMNTYYPELDPELPAKHPFCSCLFYLYLIIQTEQ